MTAFGSAWNDEPAYLIPSVEVELFEDALFGLDVLAEVELEDLDNGAEWFLLLLKSGSEPSGNLATLFIALFNLAYWEFGDLGDFFPPFLWLEALELFGDEPPLDLEFGLEPSVEGEATSKFLIS